MFKEGFIFHFYEYNLSSVGKTVLCVIQNSILSCLNCWMNIEHNLFLDKNLLFGYQQSHLPKNNSSYKYKIIKKLI